jgi:glutathione S-transferase
MGAATLTINSRNHGTWSLRGWLLCTMAGFAVDVQSTPSDDPATRAELLLLSPSFLVPCLTHGDVKVWGALAIGEYLNEIVPEAALLPVDTTARAHCRSVCGEMHSGFVNLRSSLPMNLKARHPGFKLWTGAAADIDRITTIWGDCLATYGGPYLFGEKPGLADAMFAPVCSRFVTYDVELDDRCAAYRDRIMGMPAMREWVALAEAEPDEIEELDVEF